MSKARTTAWTEVSNFLVNNPKLLGACWALALLVTQVGHALADSAGSGSGP